MCIRDRLSLVILPRHLRNSQTTLWFLTAANSLKWALSSFPVRLKHNIQCEFRVEPRTCTAWNLHWWLWGQVVQSRTILPVLHLHGGQYQYWDVLVQTDVHSSFLKESDCKLWELCMVMKNIWSDSAFLKCCLHAVSASQLAEQQNGLAVLPFLMQNRPMVVTLTVMLPPPPGIQFLVSTSLGTAWH